MPSMDVPGSVQGEVPCVAVIGAGPAGLVTARWLAKYGFEPVLFEAAAALGGQWNGANPASATWSGMRTNTTRVMSSFSDLDHAPGTPVYPSRDQMHAYLGAMRRSSTSPAVFGFKRGSRPWSGCRMGAGACAPPARKATRRKSSPTSSLRRVLTPPATCPIFPASRASPARSAWRTPPSIRARLATAADRSSLPAVPSASAPSRSPPIWRLAVPG